MNLPLVSRKRLLAEQRLLRASLFLLDQRKEDIERLQYELWASNFELARIQSAAARVVAEEGTKVTAKEPVLKFENQPLYMSEEQEDIQWQVDNEMIDTKTAEALLKDLEFENSEVQLADEYTYENFHY